MHKILLSILLALCIYFVLGKCIKHPNIKLFINTTPYSHKSNDFNLIKEKKRENKKWNNLINTNGNSYNKKDRDIKLNTPNKDECKDHDKVGLSLKFLKENEQKVIENLKIRGMEKKVDDINVMKNLIHEKNQLEIVRNNLRNKRKILSDKVKDLMLKNKDGCVNEENINIIKNEISNINENINLNETKMFELKNKIDEHFNKLPNILLNKVPEGINSKSNKIVKTYKIKNVSMWDSSDGNFLDPHENIIKKYDNNNDNIFKKSRESSNASRSYPSLTSISTIFDTDESTADGIPNKAFSENSNNMSLEDISAFLCNNIPIRHLYKIRRWEKSIIENYNKNKKLEIDKNEIKELYRDYLYGPPDIDVYNFNNNNSYTCTKLENIKQNTKDSNFIGGSNTSKIGSSASKIGSNASKSGSNTSKTGSNASKSGSNTSKIGSNTSKTGSNASKTGSSASKSGSKIKSDNGKNKIIYDASGKLDGNNNSIASKKGEKNGSANYIYNQKKSMNTKSNLKSDNKQGLEKMPSNGASGSMSSTKREELSSREGIANFCNIKSESNISSNMSATSDKKIIAKKGNKSRTNSHEKGGSNSSGNISVNDPPKSDASKCYWSDKVGNNKIEINKLKGKIQVNNNNISKYYETSPNETNFFDIPQENNALESSN